MSKPPPTDLSFRSVCRCLVLEDRAFPIHDATVTAVRRRNFRDVSTVSERCQTALEIGGALFVEGWVDVEDQELLGTLHGTEGRRVVAFRSRRTAYVLRGCAVSISVVSESTDLIRAVVHAESEINVLFLPEKEALHLAGKVW